MIIRKICPFCKKTFTTETNARKFCTNSCSRRSRRRDRHRSLVVTNRMNAGHMCQWCGKIFRAKKKRKFCCLGCKKSYINAHPTRCKETFEIPVKITLTDVAKASREQGISYGRYVVVHKLK